MGKLNGNNSRAPVPLIKPKPIPVLTRNAPLTKLRPIMLGVAILAILLALIEIVFLVQAFGTWFFGWDVGESAHGIASRQGAIWQFGYFAAESGGLAQRYVAMVVSFDNMTQEQQWATFVQAVGEKIGFDNIGNIVECRATSLISSLSGETMSEIWAQHQCDIWEQTLVAQGEWLPAPTPQFWRAFSAQLLHGGPLHLVTNLLGVLIWMPFLLLRFGGLRMLLFGLVAATSSAFAYSLWTGLILDVNLPMVGFSGIVFAMLGAHLQVAWRRSKRRGSIQPVMTVIVAMTAINLTFMLLGTPIAGDAHLGGMAVGFLIASMLMPTPQAHRSRLARMIRAKRGPHYD